ncbi:hypothetical protein C4D60_Mb02t00410 [Musa balbisiana]|uniref:Uncharacterized protein n=1 Tax=Musa balbisiana TaxID=52838 RepID=A0A4S8I785_MUSBA|nr:hypothetical protein C4D60_Mb02t00410 [Musa balbisiana]
MAMIGSILHLHAISNGLYHGSLSFPTSSAAKIQRRRGSLRVMGHQCREGPNGRGEYRHGETLLCSVAPFPLLLAATLPGAEAVRSAFEPFVELVKTWNLPDWLVHWGHPGNMEEKAKAKDLHPKLLGGMFLFFALGATGGITALLTSDKPIFESPHAVTGFIGLALLTIQSLLPTLFEENPGMRTVHGLLGSSIMTLFVLHAALGLQLGLSF